MENETEVVKFVQDNAEYYLHNPPSMKYMVRLKGKGIGAPSPRGLVRKICDKLEINLEASE